MAYHFPCFDCYLLLLLTNRHLPFYQFEIALSSSSGAEAFQSTLTFSLLRLLFVSTPAFYEFSLKYYKATDYVMIDLPQHFLYSGILLYLIKFTISMLAFCQLAMYEHTTCQHVNHFINFSFSRTKLQNKIKSLFELSVSAILGCYLALVYSMLAQQLLVFYHSISTGF